MSIFRNAGDNRKYTDTYQLFRRLNNSKYEEHEKEPSVEFRACDFIDYFEDEVQDGSISLKTLKHLTIETPSMVDFHPGDLLKNKKDQTLWRITKVTIADDNKGKDKSLRPKKKTILELGG